MSSDATLSSDRSRLRDGAAEDLRRAFPMAGAGVKNIPEELSVAAANGKRPGYDDRTAKMCDREGNKDNYTYLYKLYTMCRLR